MPIVRPNISFEAGLALIIFNIISALSLAASAGGNTLAISSCPANACFLNSKLFICLLEAVPLEAAVYADRFLLKSAN